MIIPEELAQKIVDTTMCLVHRNVNIMNRDGIMIATGHPHRYNTLHKGAKDVIETGSIIEIYPDELTHYPGALQGVNLPIVFDGQIVGVVGVFGHPDEVRDTGRLVKMITELFLERDFLQRETRSKFHSREQLIELLVTNPAKELTPKIKRIAKTQNFDLTQPRAIILIDVSAVIQKMIAEYGSSELVLDRAENTLLRIIENSNLMTMQDLTFLLDERLIILKTCSNADLLYKSNQIVEPIMNELVSSTGTSLPCGVGGIARSAIHYHASYCQAHFCLSYCNPNRSIVKIYDKNALAQYCINEALSGPAILAIDELASAFTKMAKNNSEIMHTIRILLECDLNLNLAASELHIHRNTLLYRLSRLQSELVLDPCHSVDDAILCRVLLHYFSRKNEMENPIGQRK
ncbi:MAG: transcriptional regulator, CdaR [Sporomusa sp.]|jgi:carbohydrate diacid regulator|nr:transcriptional regulator, CdaR [Sporomusa sp.]